MFLLFLNFLLLRICPCQLTRSAGGILGCTGPWGIGNGRARGCHVTHVMWWAPRDRHHTWKLEARSLKWSLVSWFSEKHKLVFNAHWNRDWAFCPDLWQAEGQRSWVPLRCMRSGFCLWEVQQTNSEKLGGTNWSRATTNGKITLGVAGWGRKKKLSYNFIIAIDHIYEDDMKLQTVIMPKKGSYSNAKWSIT